jgi:hypothetical protein
MLHLALHQPPRILQRQTGPEQILWDEMRAIRAVLAAFLAGTATAGLFVFFGVALPVWIMMIIYGRQDLQEAPAHGGMMILATAPIAGFASIPIFLFLTDALYRKLSRR